MAKLAKFRQNTRRISEGDWIEVGSSDEDRFRIKTRGQTPRFAYRLNELRREAAREANRKLTPGSPPHTVNDLPPMLDNRALGMAMVEETFLDVEGLDGESGPVTAEDFRGFLGQPEQYGVLVFLAYGAVLKIHEEREAEAVAAVGNSETASAGT